MKYCQSKTRETSLTGLYSAYHCLCTTVKTSLLLATTEEFVNFYRIINVITSQTRSKTRCLKNCTNKNLLFFNCFSLSVQSSHENLNCSESLKSMPAGLSQRQQMSMKSTIVTTISWSNVHDHNICATVGVLNIRLFVSVTTDPYLEMNTQLRPKWRQQIPDILYRQSDFFASTSL